MQANINEAEIIKRSNDSLIAKIEESAKNAQPYISKEQAADFDRRLQENARIRNQYKLELMKNKQMKDTLEANTNLKRQTFQNQGLEAEIRSQLDKSNLLIAQQ
jgi:fructose-1,6-bisphosphatase